MTNHIINIQKDQCIGCGLCVKTCVAHNMKLEDGKARLISDTCLMCGQCSAVCPKAAISISGYEETPKLQDYQKLNPNDVLDTIRFRRTIRQFQSKSVPKEVIDQILEAGRLTHTAKNKQDVSFVVLDKERANIEQMAVRLFRLLKPFANIGSSMNKRVQITDHFFFFDAPIVIVILAEDNINGILASQNMEFVAEAHGLGVLMSGFFTMAANHSRRIKKALNIPKGKKVASTLVIGYPSVKFQRSAQREPLQVLYK